MALSPAEEATIELVTAFFSIHGFDEDPDEITARLGIAADQVSRRGEVREGREEADTENWWLLQSRLRSKDVNDHLRGLLGRLKGQADALRPEWHPSFTVLWRGTNLERGGGPLYARDVVAGIAALGADLAQDVYQIVPGS